MCRVASPPFQHISVDPLGAIRVLMTGSHSGKLAPLNLCNLNTGAIAVESMVGVRAEHIYLALQRLQFRYGTEVIQGVNWGRCLG